MTGNDGLLDDAAREILNFTVQAATTDSAHRAALAASMNAALHAYTGALIAEGTSAPRAAYEAKRRATERAVELWHASAGRPKRITLYMHRTWAESGSGDGKPLYEVVGPDGRRFRGVDPVEVRGDAVAMYGAVTEVTVAEAWEVQPLALRGDYVRFRRAAVGSPPGHEELVGRVTSPVVSRAPGNATRYTVQSRGRRYVVDPSDIMAVLVVPQTPPPVEELLAALPPYLYVDEIRAGLPRDAVLMMQSVGLWTVGQVRQGGQRALERCLPVEELGAVQQVMLGWWLGDWEPAPDALTPPDPYSISGIEPYREQQARSTATPRGVCPHCGGNPAMRADGTVRQHADLRKMGVGARPLCVGSGKRSLGLPE